MSEVPNDRRYSAEHEWALERDGVIVVGITHFAQDQLGDVVFVELPEAGSTVVAGQTMGEVESTKSVSDVYSPVSGEVVRRNEDVVSNPELVNSDPYGTGWLVQIKGEASALEGLLTPEEYAAQIEGEG